MQHKLIMLAGSSPGAGKSTLSELLFDQFTRHHLPTRWIYEEDILHLDAFRPVVQAFQHGQGNAIEAILATTAQFVQESLRADLVTITDSIFPCYTWLFAANYSPPEIAAFSRQLAQLLQPLQPLIIYLNSDVARCLDRAVAQRGRQWLDELMVAMQRYTYCQSQPIQDRSDVVAFFQATSQLSRDMLTAWPHPVLMLDTTIMPLDQVATQLLDHFALTPQATVAMPAPDELQRYVGRYVAQDTTADPSPLEIRLVDHALWVDRYWPNGCRLVAEGAGRFRLQSTSQRITFAPQAGEPRWLTYIHGGREDLYDRVSAP